MAYVYIVHFYCTIEIMARCNVNDRLFISAAYVVLRFKIKIYMIIQVKIKHESDKFIGNGLWTQFSSDLVSCLNKVMRFRFVIQSLYLAAPEDS